MRRAAKVDANQGVVVEGLIEVGATVKSLAAVGNGMPDLLVGYQGRTYLLEVKDGSKPPSARKLTPMQIAWHRDWRGGDVAIVTSLDDALTAIGAQEEDR